MAYAGGAQGFPDVYCAGEAREEDVKAMTVWELIQTLTALTNEPNAEILLEVDGEIADGVSVVPDVRDGKPVIRLVDYP